MPVSGIFKFSSSMLVEEVSRLCLLDVWFVLVGNRGLFAGFLLTGRTSMTLNVLLLAGMLCSEAIIVSSLAVGHFGLIFFTALSA